MNIYYCDHYKLPLPENHRFPIEKYTLLRQRIETYGELSNRSLYVPNGASDEQLMLVHHPEYIDKVTSGILSEKELRRIGFPWSQELVERSRRSVGGTIAAARSAIDDGVAVNLAGGTHHAYPDHGEGFCVFNDCAVAAREMQAKNLAQKIVIIDLDVHQGNGTAAIFKSDSSVFTFSVHGEKNFPFRKEPGDLDIPLDDGTEDQDFIESILFGLQQIRGRFKPDLAFYLAGSDPFIGDRLGRLSVSKSGLAQRDHLVFSWCQSQQLPTVVVMGGGYARDINDTIDIHFHTVQIAAKFAKGSHR